MRLIKLWTVFSLVACAVPKPDTTLYIVNAPGQKMKGYNLSRDFDDNGRIKVGAAATVKPLEGLDDLNKYMCTDPQGLANLKAYLKTLRVEASNCLGL